MEIFQTIWTALTTENELLTKIILIPETFLESFVSALLFTTLLNLNSSRKSILKYVLIISIFANICNFLIPNPYKFFINVIVMLLSIYICFKPNILKLILSLVLPLLITVFCESFFMKLCVSYFNFDVSTILSIPLYRFLIPLAIQVLVFLVYLLIRYFKVQISIFENMSRKSRIIFVSNLGIAIIAMSIQFLVTGFYLDKLPIYIVIFSNISLIAYFLLSLYSLSKTTQYEVASLNLEQEKEYNKSLKSMQDELHGFRHDFSNILCTIGGYVQVKDMDGLTKYYSQIQKDINKVNNLGALNPDTINHPAVFALISSKYNRALENNIEMNINIFLDLNKLNMKIYEFTRILGILLDNAIEAAKECDEKVINIEIIKDTSRNRQLLIIENTYSNKDVDTDKIFEKKYSTKKGNSGLGLWEVRKILSKNTNLNLFTTKNKDFFKQQLEMYNI